MGEQQTGAPDSTAVRVALWRALHLYVDPPPHVIEDEIGLKLIAPDKSWRERPDMEPKPQASFAPRSSPALASSKIWWSNRLSGVSVST